MANREWRLYASYIQEGILLGWLLMTPPPPTTRLRRS